MKHYVAAAILARNEDEELTAGICGAGKQQGCISG
jgi:hypothetical protein